MKRRPEFMSIAPTKQKAAIPAPTRDESRVRTSMSASDPLLFCEIVANCCV
jgi:hypothetical protein